MQVNVSGSLVQQFTLTSGVPVDVSFYHSATLDVTFGWGYGHFEASNDGGSIYKNLYVYRVPTGTQYMRIDYPDKYVVDLSGYTHIKWIEEWKQATQVASTVTATFSLSPALIPMPKPKKQYEPSTPRLLNVNMVQDYRIPSDLNLATGDMYYCSGYRIFKAADYKNPATSCVEITAGGLAWGTDASIRSVKLIRRLDSGKLIAWVQKIDTNEMSVWLSDASEANFVNVLTYPWEGDFNPLWFPVIVGDVIIFTSYWSQRPFTQPLNVRFSKDGGQTWSIVHTAPLTGTGVWHYHDVGYDPYRNRLWIIGGDSLPNANVYYSDDYGVNWDTVWPIGKAPTQFTTVTPMRDHVLFGSDQSGVRSVYRYVPQVAKPTSGGLIFEPAAVFTKGTQTGDAAGRASTMPWKSGGVYYGTTYESRNSGDPYYPIVWGSKDGINFYSLHVFPFNITGAGMTFGNIMGPDKNGKLVGYLRNGAQNYTWWADAPTWTEF